MPMEESNKETIVQGLMRMLYAFPFIFSGPALLVGKGRTGAWYWGALSIVLMLAAVVLVVTGLRKVLTGFFGERR